MAELKIEEFWTFNVDENDVWQLELNNANFMLDKYRGIGGAEVKIIQIPNFYPLFGSISIIVNGHYCWSNNCILGDFNGNIDEKSFYVYPKYGMLIESGDTVDFNVYISGYKEYKVSPSKDDKTIEIDEHEGYFTVKSIKGNEFVREIEVCAYDDKGNKEQCETVIVEQCDGEDILKNKLIVTPQIINLTDENKSFSVNVHSLCNGNVDYKFECTDKSAIKLEQSGGVIIGKVVDSSKSFKEQIIIKNGCEEKLVIVNFIKNSDKTSEFYLKKVDSSEFNEKKESYRFTYGKKTEYSKNILSFNERHVFTLNKSEFELISYPQNVISVNVSSNELRIDLTDTNESFGNQIKLKDLNENKYVFINFSVEANLLDKKGYEFYIKNKDVTSKEVDYTENGAEVEITSLCDEKPWKWKIFKNDGIMKYDVYVNNVSVDTNIDGGNNVKLLIKTNTTSIPEAYKGKIILQQYDSLNNIEITVNHTKNEFKSSDFDKEYTLSINGGGKYTHENAKDGIMITVTPSVVYKHKKGLVMDRTYYITDNCSPNRDPWFDGIYASVSDTSTPSGFSLTKLDRNNKDSLNYMLKTDLEQGSENDVSINITAKTQTASRCDGGYVDVDCAKYSVCSATTVVLIDKVEMEKDVYIFQLVNDKDERIEAEYNANTVEIPIETTKNGSCHPYSVSVNVDVDWLTIKAYDNHSSQNQCDLLILEFKENETFDIRECEITLTQFEGSTLPPIVISVSQKTDGTISISNFDYLTIRYLWSDSNGKDLDTITVMSNILSPHPNKNYLTETSLESVYEKELGYGSSNGYSVCKSSGDTDCVMFWAKDNTSSGTEAVYLNFKNLLNEDVVKELLLKGRKKIEIDFYGTWYSNRNDGKCDVEINAYSGGTMSESNYNFVNNGGVSVYSGIGHTQVCSNTKGSTRYKNTYTPLGYVLYDLKSASALFVLYPLCVIDKYTGYTFTFNDKEELKTVSSNPNGTSGRFDIISTKGSNNIGYVVSEVFSFIRIKQNMTYIEYELLPNNLNRRRIAKLHLIQNESGKVITINFTQSMSEYVFKLVNQSDGNIVTNKDSKFINIPIASKKDGSDMAFTVISGETEWVTATPEIGNLKLELLQNGGENERTTTITIEQQQSKSKLDIVVTQQSFDYFFSVSADTSVNTLDINLTADELSKVIKIYSKKENSSQPYKVQSVEGDFIETVIGNQFEGVSDFTIKLFENIGGITINDRKI